MCIRDRYNRIGTSEALDELTRIRDEGLLESLYFEVCGDDVITLTSSAKYFNSLKGKYEYRWDEWLRNIETSPTVEKILIEYPTVMETLDPIDVMVLKMLYEDPMIDYVEMGAKLGINYQTLRYHYLKHVKNTILGWASFILPIGYGEAYLAYVQVDFPSTAKMNMYLNALYKTPLILDVCKVKGRPSIIATHYFPQDDGEKFLWLYEELLDRGIISNYDVSVMIPSSTRVNPAPPL